MSPTKAFAPSKDVHLKSPAFASGSVYLLADYPDHPMQFLFVQCIIIPYQKTMTDPTKELHWSSWVAARFRQFSLNPKPEAQTPNPNPPQS